MLRIKVTRDRMGRMLTMLARIMEDVASPPVSLAHAVGIDEHTALLLDITSGDVTAVGVGTAYVCTADHKADVCKSKTALTYKGMEKIFSLSHTRTYTHMLLYAKYDKTILNNNSILFLFQG